MRIIQRVSYSTQRVTAHRYPSVMSVCIINEQVPLRSVQAHRYGSDQEEPGRCTNYFSTKLDHPGLEKYFSVEFYSDPIAWYGICKHGVCAACYDGYTRCAGGRIKQTCRNGQARTTSTFSCTCLVTNHAASVHDILMGFYGSGRKLMTPSSRTS